ncbi:LLM class flavin-dependent oxidoreductase [Nonomuraea sp. NPDC050451]|uniref:LLM class flavin-dependent oxidoreductase n=1 Tax=Nonomuraea sp. NPDC050451 TaxID=3364364 RepID=UPI00379D87AC
MDDASVPQAHLMNPIHRELPSVRHQRPAVPLSVLDLATVSAGTGAATAFRTTTEVAKTAERLGFQRLWLAEHHSIPDIASTSPAVLLAHLAAHTTTIRLGSGGVMLPNHTPLTVAEQFLTLEALHPGRVDLGVGRAPGGHPAVAQALRRSDADFGEQVEQLMGFLDGFFSPGHPYAGIQVARAVNAPPLWILGASEQGARLAGRLGRPFAFAYHLRPGETRAALAAYRESFQPSDVLDRPYVMVSVWVVAGDTSEEARAMVRAAGLAMARMRNGRPTAFPSPEEAARHSFSQDEEETLRRWLRDVAHGDASEVRAVLDRLAESTGADELMLVSHVHGHRSRLRTLELVAGAYELEQASALTSGAAS